MTISSNPEKQEVQEFPLTIGEITIDYYCEGPGGINSVDVCVAGFGIQIPLEDSDQIVSAIVKAQQELKELVAELPPVESTEEEEDG